MEYDAYSSGNDENESESQRNSQEIGAKSPHHIKQSSPKQFMAPTISAASKFTSPKKKIFSKRIEVSKDTRLQKPSILGPKLSSPKVGFSNSGSRKPLPKIPPLSSPIRVLETFDNGDCEIGFASDSGFRKSVPEIPLLSSPQVVLESDYNGENESGFVSDPVFRKCMPEIPQLSSPNVVLGSDYNGGNINGFVVDSGFRTSLPEIPPLSPPNVVLKSDYNGDSESGFVTDSSTKPYDPLSNYLSPRPKYLRYNPNRRRKVVVLRESEQGSSASPSFSLDSQGSAVDLTEESSLIDGAESGDIEEIVTDEDEEEVIEERGWSLRWGLCKFFAVLAVLVISTKHLSSMDSYFPLDSGLKVEYQTFGNGSLGVNSMGSVEFDNRVFDGRGGSEMGTYEINEIAVEEGWKSRQGYQIGYNEHLEDYQLVVRLDVEVDFEPVLEVLNDGKVENEEPVMVRDSNQECEEEEEAVEAEILGSDSIEVTEEDLGLGFDDKMAGSELKLEQMELTDEAETFAQDSVEGTKEENQPQEVFGMTDFEPKSEVIEHLNVENQEENVVSETNYNDELPEIKAEIVGDITEENIGPNGNNQMWLSSKNVFHLVISSLMAFVAFLAAKFSLKSHKVSSRILSSKVKPSFQSIQTTVNSTPVAPLSEEKLEKTPKIIPKVKQLNEFVVNGDFSSSLNNSCAIQSTKQDSEFSLHSVPQERRVQRGNTNRSGATPNHLQPTASDISTADSFSHVSYNSYGYSTENGNEERTQATPTPLRRSTRIRNRGVTSP